MCGYLKLDSGSGQWGQVMKFWSTAFICGYLNVMCVCVCVCVYVCDIWYDWDQLLVLWLNLDHAWLPPNFIHTHTSSETPKIKHTHTISLSVVIFLYSLFLTLF